MQNVFKQSLCPFSLYCWKLGMKATGIWLLQFHTLDSLFSILHIVWLVLCPLKQLMPWNLLRGILIPEVPSSSSWHQTDHQPSIWSKLLGWHRVKETIIIVNIHHPHDGSSVSHLWITSSSVKLQNIISGLQNIKPFNVQKMKKSSIQVASANYILVLFISTDWGHTTKMEKFKCSCI